MSALDAVADLIEGGYTEAATQLARTIAENERLSAERKAYEFELRWLLGHIREERFTITWSNDSDPEDRVIVRADRATDGAPWAGLLATDCARLRALLKGEIPALRAYVEGRTP
jgi:hypothetical protein